MPKSRLLAPSQKEWQVAKLVPGGAGFLRLENGQGAFARGALPGELIRVDEAEDHRAYLQATRWSLLAASPDRVLPLCPVQARCGGCDLMTLDYGAQLRAKVEILRDALSRTGRFDTLPELEFIGSEEELGYRSRIRLHVDREGRIGFYAASSRELVEIPSCLVAHSELNEALDRLRSLSAMYAAELAQFGEIEVRVAAAGPRLSLRLLPRDPRLVASQALISALAKCFSVSLAERASPDEADQRFPLSEGVALRAPAAAFTQVNWAVNQRLIQALIEGAERRAVKSFCDLYCGAGNFSLPLLARGLPGLGIEASEVAVAAAQRSAAEQGLANARFIAGLVSDVLRSLPESQPFDLTVLDPPRAGARDILPELIRRAPRLIAYCACDPVTLSRDLRALCDAGYALEQICGFDMFPQTHHFETLAWLTRRP